MVIYLKAYSWTSKNKAANQRFDSCEPAIKVGDLYRYTENNTDPPWPM